MAARLRVLWPDGRRSTVTAMLQDPRTPPLVNVAWHAEGILMGLSPRKASRLLRDIERRLQDLGFVSAQARVFDPRVQRAGPILPPHPETAGTGEGRVWLWGLVLGALTRLW
ncbi:MAG TPA: hypothetical protein VNM43_05080 [Dehalococcoidia bacterium]|nr:hypothetical protein [Dehalococcoidia bacterium]